MADCGVHSSTLPIGAPSSSGRLLALLLECRRPGSEAEEPAGKLDVLDEVPAKFWYAHACTVYTMCIGLKSYQNGASVGATQSVRGAQL
jgi:hypothetical protein